LIINRAKFETVKSEKMAAKNPSSQE